VFERDVQSPPALSIRDLLLEQRRGEECLPVAVGLFRLDLDRDPFGRLGQVAVAAAVDVKHVAVEHQPDAGLRLRAEWPSASKQYFGVLDL
jgi:hypothetical protein